MLFKIVSAGVLKPITAGDLHMQHWQMTTVDMENLKYMSPYIRMFWLYCWSKFVCLKHTSISWPNDGSIGSILEHYHEDQIYPHINLNPTVLWHLPIPNKSFWSTPLGQRDWVISFLVGPWNWDGTQVNKAAKLLIFWYTKTTNSKDGNHELNVMRTGYNITSESERNSIVLKIHIVWGKICAN